MSVTASLDTTKKAVLSYHVIKPENVDMFVEYLDTIREFDEISDVIPSDKAMVKTQFHEMIENNAGFAILAVRDGRPVGCIVTSLHTLWWSKMEFLTNILIYVDPSARGTSVFRDMLNSVKEFALGVGKKLYINTVSGPETRWDTYDRIFTIMGFEKVGTSFLLRDTLRKKAA